METLKNQDNAETTACLRKSESGTSTYSFYTLKIYYLGFLGSLLFVNSINIESQNHSKWEKLFEFPVPTQEKKVRKFLLD